MLGMIIFSAQPLQYFHKKLKYFLSKEMEAEVKHQFPVNFSPSKHQLSKSLMLSDGWKQKWQTKSWKQTNCTNANIFRRRGIYVTDDYSRLVQIS